MRPSADLLKDLVGATGLENQKRVVGRGYIAHEGWFKTHGRNAEWANCD